MSVTVTAKACRGCLACLAACGSGVFEARISRNHKVAVVAAHPENCVYCLVCLPLCPFAALTMALSGPGPVRGKARKG
ncbi:MAG: ferredoxin family protein [Deltaproteobacteria bacterium]|jgi:NAD-dependent dihydropyrimidine dehydrogenase PreA subunit|nr:ferredoxin family protein [Deltaproteobacteria bacterium]